MPGLLASQGQFQAMDGTTPAQGAPDATLGPAASGPIALLPPPPPPDVGALLRLAAWLALLFAGYGIQRGLCAAGLPYDCDGMDGAEAFTCVTLLVLLGGALAWLVGATHPTRFAWLIAPQRAYLWAVYAAVFPAYSALSNIPALQASLASKSVSPAFLAVNIAGEGRQQGAWETLRYSSAMKCCLKWPSHSAPHHPFACTTGCSWCGGAGSAVISCLAGRAASTSQHAQRQQRAFVPSFRCSSRGQRSGGLAAVGHLCWSRQPAGS